MTDSHHEPDPKSKPAAYLIDGEMATPTDLARGPWFGEQQHGAAVCGLLTRFLERVPSAQPMRFTRITADISRAVPMKPLSVAARPLRDGRRVQSLEAMITDGVDIIARAVATRIRVEPDLVPPDVIAPIYPEDLAPSFEAQPVDFDMGYTSFHDLLEIRQGEPDRFGRSPTWYRTVHDLVEGEPMSPTVRMAALGDMIMSSSEHLGPDWISINPELMVQIERAPIGDWLCNLASIRFTDDGVGVSSGAMFDRQGRVGGSSKSVLNMRR